MKNVGNSSRGRSQGVMKIFRAPYRAHCAVIFATAQLSCFTSRPGLFRMARLVRAALEFYTRRFCPRLIFAVFGRRLTAPLNSFINLEFFEYFFAVLLPIIC